MNHPIEDLPKGWAGAFYTYRNFATNCPTCEIHIYEKDTGSEVMCMVIQYEWDLTFSVRRVADEQLQMLA